MKKQEPRKSDLHLDALYPEMPASFSQRIDEALFQARSSRTYGKRWSSRNRRGVMAACACAAAFVAVCGAVLFLPSLRAQREAREIHDRIEAHYNPTVDFDALRRFAHEHARQALD